MEGDAPESRLSGDWEQLLSIFPEEIWAIILDKVHDTNDCENLYQSSSLFRQLLLPRRVQFLFPKIWSILSVQNYQRLKFGSLNLDHRSLFFTSPGSFQVRRLLRQQMEDMDSTCYECKKQKGISWLTHFDILDLRLICKNWCSAIENYYENFNPTPFKNNIETPKFCDCLLNNKLEQTTAELQRLQLFDRYFHETHNTGNRSPFLGRRLSINYKGRADNQFLNEITTLLEKYGHHIWCFSLKFVDEFPFRKNCFNLLRKILGLIPNVHFLEIILNPWRPEDNSPIWATQPRYISRAEIAELNEEIVLNPLPQLENLKYFRGENVYGPILNHIISNNQLEYYDLSRTKIKDLFLLPLSKMKSLQITFFSDEHFYSFESQLMNPPLEKLEINFVRENSITFPRIITLLENKWADTLVEVGIKIPESFDENCSSFRMNLNKLKKLKLFLCRAITLDFILPMKDTLECLEITANCVLLSGDQAFEELKNGQIIQFLGWTDRLLGSNIWGVCPNLKKLNYCSLMGHRNKFSHLREHSYVPMNELFQF